MYFNQMLKFIISDIEEMHNTMHILQKLELWM